MQTTAIVLAAGQGTRMHSTLPKILHPVGGKAMITHVVDAFKALNPRQTIIVTSPDLADHEIICESGATIAVQEKPLGTGSAVMAAIAHMQDSDGDALILCGDTPLIQSTTLALLTKERATAGPDDIIMLAMHLEDPRRYGRLITDAVYVTSIVEDKDADPQTRAITLCNTGIYLMPVAVLRKLLPQLSNSNAAGEYYLTDIISLAAQQGIKTRYVECDQPHTLHGINNRLELAEAEQQLQQRWRHQLMLSGVTMHDPQSVYLYHDTIIGKDTVIYPHVTFGPNVRVAEQAVIYPYCVLSNCQVGMAAKVGPFAHLRNEAILQTKAEVGNFVEIKNSTLAERAKAKHLSYIGDATIGAGANIGAGTITCNYNGFKKAKTIIGAGAFIGSNSALVAPVVIGEGAIVGAGSVITKDIPNNALGFARATQQNKEEWATFFRKKFTL